MVMVPQSGKVATVRWNPPTVGSHSGFKLKVGNLVAFCISVKYVAHMWWILWTSLQVKTTLPGDPDLWTWNNDQEHRHPWDQVGVVAVMRKLKKQKTVVDHHTNFNIFDPFFMTWSSPPQPPSISYHIFRSTLRDLTPGATYEIQLFTVILNNLCHLRK